MARLVAVTLILFVVCTMLIAGARAWGRFQTPPPTYLAPGDCAQPCWQGLRPGEVNADEFTAAAQTLTPWESTVRAYDDLIARQFSLVPANALTLADLIRTFGPPERVDCMIPNRIETPAGGAWAASIHLFWADGLVSAEAMNMGGMRLAPEMQVWDVTYYAPGEPAYPIGKTLDWRGMASPVRYPVCWLE